MVHDAGDVIRLCCVEKVVERPRYSEERGEAGGQADETFSFPDEWASSNINNNNEGVPIY